MKKEKTVSKETVFFLFEYKRTDPLGAGSVDKDISFF